eukprot:2477479-Pleurochrysis_carterae.AAC.1
MLVAYCDPLQGPMSRITCTNRVTWQVMCQGVLSPWRHPRNAQLRTYNSVRPVVTDGVHRSRNIHTALA